MYTDHIIMSEDDILFDKIFFFSFVYICLSLTAKKTTVGKGVKCADIYISEKLQTYVWTSQLFLSSQSLSSSAAFGS